ncbi:MAG: polyphosphate kinase 2 family protein [Propionibacteriaceae bacterium]|nr:polyphosphate kinase 2 family protein [Propionibacteriaceae bacterium]
MSTAVSVASLLRAKPNSSITDYDPDATPGYPGKGKEDGPALTAKIGDRLSELQERLYAEGKGDGPDRSVLVVLQGMDTSGKGGTVRHVFGLVDPQGLLLHAFKQPTKEELSHDFLWRIRQHLPSRGLIGIFDRSQYEDVLVVRVDELVEPAIWEPRYEAINDFEKSLADSGMKIIKCFLNISADEQKGRLLERLADPSKHWKYSHGDVKVRAKWNAYMEAYEDALNNCNTDAAPWYVIPANKKWYRDWAVATLLLEALEEMNPQWPAGDFDVEAEIVAVNESLPVADVSSDDSKVSKDKKAKKK